jgi:hypothetical protein
LSGVVVMFINIHDNLVGYTLWMYAYVILVSGLNSSSVIPTYCIDEKVKMIFQTRLNECLGTHSPIEELEYLHRSSTAHYASAQELIAYQYFTNIHNPSQRPCHDEPDLEYIPILPLAWKVGFPTRTSCTAGGVCPRYPLSNSKCHIKYLIEDILTYVKYVKLKEPEHKQPLPFIVTGAQNVKTILADGMPTQIRRGSAWNDIKWFVGNIALLSSNNINFS